MKLCSLSFIALLSALLAPAAFPAINLQITEVWPGQLASGKVTEDWFEITNFGSTAWTPADGDLYYDDGSANASQAELIQGISSIAAGQSVVVVVGRSNDAAEFNPAWGLALSPVGYTGPAAALGFSGDAVTLWMILTSLLQSRQAPGY